MDPQTFGRYQIVRKLAGGGMGRVFLVWDPVLNQNVGLKLIDTGNDQESLDVVAAERSGASLQDQLAKSEPGGRVAQIYDVGERDGYFFVAMEYVDGEDLSEMVARGPIPPERAVRIAIDILAVLSRAHNFETVIDGRSHRGIIHGDIKPRNIRIMPNGQVKVLDFGIAKAVSMTRSITFNQYGSVPYSSPERIRTGDVDARSDVWSVAVVLFEMLVGRAYFTADTSARLEVKIRDYDTRSRDLTNLPPGLREILARALDPEFSRRFPSASTLEKALEEWCAGGKAALLAQDPDATRRTSVASGPDNDEEITRRPFFPPPYLPPQPSRRVDDDVMDDDREESSLPFLSKVAVATMCLVGVLGIIYAARVSNRPAPPQPRAISLSKHASPEPAASTPGADPATNTLPALPARSPEAVKSSDAERVIAQYRQSGDGPPVSGADWERARSAANSALAVSSDDPALRAAHQIIEGHLRLRSRDAKGAQAAFDDAQTLSPHSPDPDLGLALTFIAEGNPTKAEDALNTARDNGFEPGRREQRALADSYRKRGEYLIVAARKALALSAMEDSYKRAISDLNRARDLYTGADPNLAGPALIAKVTFDRDHAASVLSQVRRMGPKNPPAMYRVEPGGKSYPVQASVARPKIPAPVHHTRRLTTKNTKGTAARKQATGVSP